MATDLLSLRLAFRALSDDPEGDDDNAFADGSDDADTDLDDTEEEAEDTDAGEDEGDGEVAE